LKAFGKLKKNKRNKQSQVEEGIEEETLTSAGNDAQSAGNSALQGGRESELRHTARSRWKEEQRQKKDGRKDTTLFLTSAIGGVDVE
jgi:hypothetical protein